MIRADGNYLYVGDRRWFGHFTSEDSPEWKTRRFHVLFESKWTASIIWGYCTHSDNYELPFYNTEQSFQEEPECVEVGILHADRSGLQPDGYPFDYIDEYDLNAILEHLSTLATEANFEWEKV